VAGRTDSPVDGTREPSQLWSTIAPIRRKVVLAALSAGFSSLILVDVLFRMQESVPGGVREAILYTPFQLSAITYSGLTVLSVLTCTRYNRESKVEPETLRLGTVWLLASIPLIMDYMIDSFEPKLPVIALFLYVGVRYWNGARNSYVALVMAPLMVVIASLDGLFHLMGNFCSATAFDSCSVKGVSDVYLTMVFLVLTYVTIAGRGKRIGVKELVIIVVVACLVLLGLSLTA
jgi:hypothetical protein